jgi:hypothetical protein
LVSRWTVLGDVHRIWESTRRKDKKYEKRAEDCPSCNQAKSPESNSFDQQSTLFNNQ